MQSMVLSRGSISSVYAIVIPVRPLFATSSFTQSTGIHSDTVIGTALRRACGADCIRLLYMPHNAVTGQPVLKLYPLKVGSSAAKTFQIPGETVTALKFQAETALFFRRKFCHSDLDSCKLQQQAIPPNLFDHARSIAIAGMTVTIRVSRFLFWKRAIFFSCPLSSRNLHPQGSPHIRVFVTGRSLFARQKAAKNTSFAGRA